MGLCPFHTFSSLRTFWPTLPPPPYRHGLSLLRGWLPITIEIVAALVVVAAIGWRTRRWRLVWVPVAIVVGLALAAWAHWYVDSQGLAGDPAPDALWIWTGLTGFAIGVAILGWRRTGWWRRAASLAAVPLCLLTTAMALNTWVGYFPTVQVAWNQLTAGPLPDETDPATIAAMQKAGTVLSHGSVVKVDIPDTASGFKHRTELVYLPPKWFATNPPPKLPVVMMIAGEFNTPADWLRTGNAAAIVDNLAQAHGGNAPVLVFVDSGGSFNNDTECVNGVRGNVADHLTKDVVPYVNAHYGTSASPADWGIVGWSMGGTCAVDLTVMHPELFNSFVDIAGDTGPNAGTHDQTVARLYGGNASAWAAVRPGDGDHQTRSLQGGFGLVRDLHRQADPAQVRHGRGRGRARRTRRGGHANRSDRSGQHALRPRPGERHHVLGGADDGPPRLATGHQRIHCVTAMAGRGGAHPWLPGHPAARGRARRPRRTCGHGGGVRLPAGTSGRLRLTRRADGAARGCGHDSRARRRRWRRRTRRPLPREVRQGDR